MFSKQTMKRLILFDIDGTLLATRGGAKRAFHRAMLEVYGTAGPIETHPFDGKTDPQIVRELLRLDGFSDSAIDERMGALWHVYLRELEQELLAASPRVYPGVEDVLHALGERRDHAHVALLTGNIVGGAQIKLRSAALDRHFDFDAGAFGSDCERRDGLPEIAVRRALERTGIRFQRRQVVIIGDTPNDVTCGRSLDVFTIAVATGRYSRDQLAAAGAHVVLDDLSDTERVLELLA